VSGETRTVGIIGWPVAHSLSPAIHNAAFEALGLDWVYLPLPVPPGELADALAGLRALGFSGANVTMPYKGEVAERMADLSEDAERLHAVNTIVFGSEGPAGENTDAPGFERFLRRDAGFESRGSTALVYGAGGAARACSLALARGGLEHLTVAARDLGRADGVREAVDGFGTRLSLVGFDDAQDASADLIVNATPLGARDETLPLPRLDAHTLVVDLLYRPSLTPLLAAAREVGAPAFGGLGLLLHQAALSFERWTGQAPPLDVMSAAALAELAERPGGSPSAEA